MYYHIKISLRYYIINLVLCCVSLKAIFLIRQIINKYKEHQKNLHMIFIDLKKAYDKVHRELWVLRRKHVFQCYVQIIKDAYKDVVTNVRFVGGMSRGSMTSSRIDFKPLHICFCYG